MKLITAVIRETQLEAVHEQLIKNEIGRITVSRVSGHGRQLKEEIYRGNIVKPTLIPKTKIEVAVNEEFVDLTVQTIINAARTENGGEEGAVGDGKIFITNLEECIRIRTGERGGSAI